MRRVEVEFAPGVRIPFMNRDSALEELQSIAERGTRLPLVIYGPEGCGKTALLRQSMTLLEEYGYRVVLFDMMAGDVRKALSYTPDLQSVIHEALSLLPSPLDAASRLVLTVVRLLVSRLRGERIAVLVDEGFQAVGLERVESFAKSLLDLIEYPPGEYERIVVLVASSEGLSRERLARHAWVEARWLWNMSRGGFRALYGRLPGPKPGFEQAWRVTGGNPRLLARLYMLGWSVEGLRRWIVAVKSLDELVAGLGASDRRLLREALADPDVLASPEAVGLRRLLVERNLVSYIPSIRGREVWLDEPPAERDEELGVGRLYAWQAPVYRDVLASLLSG